MTTTIGIEEELLLVDGERGGLVTRAPDVLGRARPHLGDLVTSELNRCQIEVNTVICEDLDQAHREIVRLRAGLIDAGHEVGVRPVALASHPWSAWDDQEVNSDSDHYRTLLGDYQQVARQQVICGCHIHVGVDDPDGRIQVMNGVRPWLPTLLALSANSPWWQGTDTGYASYRTIVWRAWPTAAMPPTVDDFAAYQRLVGDLEKSEAIDTPAALYWYVRPAAELPTVEFRVCDVCLRADDTVTIAGLARALTTTVLAGKSPALSQPPTILDSGLWRAARFGLTGTLLDPETHRVVAAATVVHHLLEWVETALRDAGDHERVTDGVATILSRGNGAAVQRRTVAASADQARALRAFGDITGREA